MPIPPGLLLFFDGDDDFGALLGDFLAFVFAPPFCLRALAPAFNIFLIAVFWAAESLFFFLGGNAAAIGGKAIAGASRAFSGAAGAFCSGTAFDAFTFDGARVGDVLSGFFGLRPITKFTLFLMQLFAHQRVTTKIVIHFVKKSKFAKIAKKKRPARPSHKDFERNLKFHHLS